MKKLLQILFLTVFIFTSNAIRADEGMWLLQLMKEQHSIDLMKKQGLLLDADSLYNPNTVSLKDAVGIFGGGCTGEIISPDGLILTNHHCGYASIQQHSSVEHDYLTNGFWAKNRNEELPTPGLSFTFVERIVDITDSVNADIAAGRISEAFSLTYNYLDSLSQSQLKQSDLNGKPGISAEALPYFAGNKFYLIYTKVYPDVRMVVAPPSSIGKFGGETDNWMWPRHTGDFSMFRIYADSLGQPAAYSAHNIPLKVKKFLPISLKGFKEGEYAMIMGFPGSTERYLTASEISSRVQNENTPRILIREARLNLLREAMAASDSIRIMYASKFAQSSNYWKNSLGMNLAIKKNKTIEKKQEQEMRFAQFADSLQNTGYQNVVKKIDSIMIKYADLFYEQTCWYEALYNAIEFGSPYATFDALKDALKTNNKAQQDSLITALNASFYKIHNKDYDHELDRRIAKTILPLYAKMNKDGKLPDFYNTIQTKYKGDYNRYVDDLYNKSIFASEKNFKKFLKKPSVKAIENDPMIQFSEAKWKKYYDLKEESKAPREELELLHKCYVRGLGEMNATHPQYPDANFTIRLTYGNIKPYSPGDAINYNYFTTLKGVMEKEDPSNPEFIVPIELKKLYEKKDYGRYAMPDGELPVCFISTNDITGGNSGSPVINAEGQLIGCAFDGNWESLSGDIQFDNDLQRCICVDIRYILFIVDKLGKCPWLIEEMKIIE